MLNILKKVLLILDGLMLIVLIVFINTIKSNDFDMDYLDILFIFTCISLVLAVFSIVVNITSLIRSKRKKTNK